MSLCIWDTEAEDSLVRNYDHHTEFVLGCDFNNFVENQIASVSWDQQVFVWTVQAKSAAGGGGGGAKAAGAAAATGAGAGAGAGSGAASSEQKAATSSSSTTAAGSGAGAGASVPKDAGKS